MITRTAIKLLDPFARDVVDSPFSNVPLRSAGLVPAELNSRIRNMRLSPLRFAINRRPPTVVATTTDGGGLAYVGQDGTFAALLAAKMNATPVYVSEPSDNGKIYYGYRRSGDRAYGTFAGVVDGTADVSVNGHFLKDYNCHMAELTRHVRIVLAVAFSKRVKSAYRESLFDISKRRTCQYFFSNRNVLINRVCE